MVYATDFSVTEAICDINKHHDERLRERVLLSVYSKISTNMSIKIRGSQYGHERG